MRSMFLLWIFLWMQSTTTTQQPQPNQQTASIEGLVVRLGTTDGISRARVTLSGVGTPQAVMADTEGKFVFRELAAGTYRITVTRDGFVAAEHGQRGPNSQGVPIVLSHQQQLRDVRISMTENGTIAGRVRNRYGEPSVNATVQALRYTYQEGKKSLTPAQSVRSNDLGEFRLFWLPPGEYIVSAQPSDIIGPGGGDTLFMTGVGARAAAPPLGTGGITRIIVSSPTGVGAAGMPPPPPPPPGTLGRGAIAEPTEVSLPVYFPNTTDATRASAIDLRPGATVGGIDFTVVEARAVRLRGQVFANGQPARGASVSIFQRGGSFGGLVLRSTNVNDTGAFEFRGLAPGSYELVATTTGSGTVMFMETTPFGAAGGATAGVVTAARPLPADVPRMGARTQVDIASADIDGVTLSMDAGATVSGRVTLQGRAPSANDSPITSLRVQLQSDPVIPPLMIPPVPVNQDGTFTISGVTSGQYRLVFLGLPRNSYVESARLAGVDMLNDGLRIDGDPRGLLDVVLGTTPGTVEATVTDDRRLPIAGITVALVPDSSWQKRFDVYRSATTDAAGRIRLEGVVPGNYTVYAWEEVTPNAWTDADFIRNFENRGTPVRVEPGGAAAVEARVIPFKLN